VIPMSYRTILSATWEIAHLSAGIDHGVGHEWALRVRSESSNAPYSTKIIPNFVPVSVTNITIPDEFVTLGIGLSNAILAPPSPANHRQNHPWETPAGLARAAGDGDWHQLHPAPACGPVTSAGERRAAGHEQGAGQGKARNLLCKDCNNLVEIYPTRAGTALP
jgi:hypothetical protein